MNHAIKFLLLTAMLLSTATTAFCDPAENSSTSSGGQNRINYEKVAVGDKEKALEPNLNSADSYNDRGVARMDKGDLDGAIADYNKAIELRPRFAWAYNNRSIVKQSKRDWDGAIEDCTKAIETIPRFPAAYLNRGIAKRLKGDPVGAIADMTEAIRFYPKDFKAYGARGDAKRDKGDLDGAIADYTKAIEINPEFAYLYIMRASVKKTKDDFDGAIADCTKAIGLDPKLVGVYSMRAFLHYDSQAFKDALIDLRKMVELDPSGYFSDYSRCWIYLTRSRLGETEAATAELKKYLAGRTVGKPDDWAVKIGRFLTGQLAEPEFLAAAKNADLKMEAGQLCEAYYYAGSKRLLAGDKATAADYFQKSIATNQKENLEYTSAKAELKLLKAQKN